MRLLARSSDVEAIRDAVGIVTLAERSEAVRWMHVLGGH